MKKNMIEWKNSIIASKERKAMPIMTYPGLGIVGKTVLDMVMQGEVQYSCIKALSNRYPTAACATLIMALYVEAEAFGSEINFSQTEIPTVSKRLILFRLVSQSENT
jgi:uroporphyrinogen decarboxylase